MKVSIIIPVYNERAVIRSCLASLQKQTYKDTETIVVDDGSTDSTVEIVNSLGVKLLKQNHLGPGAARNLGAQKATGEILAFLDADMEFEDHFITELVKPILDKKTIGTYSTEENLLNTNDPWAICWNLNFAGNASRLLNKPTFSTNGFYHWLKKQLENLEKKLAPIDHQNITSLTAVSNSQLPYRAILKSEFEKVGGFTTTVGYTDDWTLTQKLGKLPTPVKAKYYHRNPSSLVEIWQQARWIGKDQLKTGNLVRQLYSLIRFNPLMAVIRGIYQAVIFTNWRMLPFQLVYSTGVWISVLLSFFGKKRAR